MRLSAKNGLLAIILMVLMFGIAGTGYWSNLQLSKILTYITGPAWDTADGAMESTIGIGSEMGWMQSLLLGVAVEEQQLNDAMAMTDEAFGRLVAAQVMAKSQSDKVAEQLQGFRTAFVKLRQAHEKMKQLRGQLEENAKPMSQIGESMEKLGDAQMDSLDPNQTISIGGILLKRWAAADGGMESQIGFYSQMYYLEQLAHAADYEKIPAVITDALAFQQDAVNAMVDSGVFDIPLEGSGGQSASKRYGELFIKHRNLVTQLIEATLSFRQQFKQTYGHVNLLLGSLGEFEELGDSAVEGQMSNVAKIHKTTQAATLFVLCIVALAVAGSYFMLKIFILAPIYQLHSRLQDLIRGEGDLTARIDNLRDDEVGDLGRSINQLMDLLHQLVIKINQKSYSIIQKIGTNKSVAVSTFNHAKSVADHAHNLAAASGQLFNAAGSIASACSNAANSVIEVRNNTFNSRDTTLNTSTGMGRVRDQVSELSDRITQLRNSAEKIGEIVSVIGGISDQTNLLALNAAIEAARAGEQGRGFAVVADEVRTLASRTSQSTVEIGDVIRTIQDMSQSAFQLINACAQEVNNKAQDSQTVSSSLNQLTRVVDDLSSLIDQAASAAEQQTSVTKDMTHRVTEIAEAASGVDVEACTSMGCADELSQLAQELNLELLRFKV
jgi:methyl-accepting chemotaxis protein